MMPILSAPSSSFSPLSPPHPHLSCRRGRGVAPSIHSLPFAGRTVLRLPSRRCSSAPKTEVQQSAEAEEEEQDERDEEPPTEDIKVLTAVRSYYNEIMILETPESRLLLLDSTHNVHSIFNKGASKWTNSYWDEFASLPPIIPDGPIAIFGLGGGTAAKLILELWPSLQLEGWEIDEILIHKSRDYLRLSELEEPTEAGGGLEVRIGDALSANASIVGGYAGIIVDLFGNGKVLPELEEVKTWTEIRKKLKPNGRIMVNCGGASEGDYHEDGRWEQNYAIRAMSQAFPQGELYWKLMPKDKGANFLALTGALPDLLAWSSALPHELSSIVHQWRICLPS